MRDNMNVLATTLVKTNSGIMEVSTNGKLMGDRVLFIEGEINTITAMTFAKQMLDLISRSPYEPIKVIINSQGGVIEDGMIFLDAIAGSSAPVEMYCIGKAYSMAAIIFISGTSGRYILPNARIMLHQPYIKDISGNISEMKQVVTDLEKWKEQLFSLVIKHSAYSKKQLEKEVVEDRYFSASEAVKLGLADKIVTFSEIVN